MIRTIIAAIVASVLPLGAPALAQQTFDQNGNANVNCKVGCSNGGGGGLSVTDQAIWTQGTSAFTPTGGVFNNTATLASGQQGTVRLTSTRNMLVDCDSNNTLCSLLGGSIPQGAFWIGATDIVVTPISSFTRPANTTTYGAGQLFANSTTAGSVTPLSWTVARVNGGNGYVRRFKMTLSSKSITNTSFRLHLYTVSPTVTNGDGGTFVSTEANEICTLTSLVSTTDPVNWTAGSDVSVGYGTPSQGSECQFVATGGTTTIFGLEETRAAYGPASAETATVTLEVHEN